VTTPAQTAVDVEWIITGSPTGLVGVPLEDFEQQIRRVAFQHAVRDLEDHELTAEERRRLESTFNAAAVGAVRGERTRVSIDVNPRQSWLPGYLEAYRKRVEAVWQSVHTEWRRARALGARPFTEAVISVDRVAVHVAQGLVGSDPRRVDSMRSAANGPCKPSAALRRGDDHSIPASMVFVWDDGARTELELGVDDLTVGPLTAIQRRYGEAAVRDLQALYFLAWGNGARPGLWWWWPDEHLELVDLAHNRDNVRALRERMNRLHHTLLEAHYDTGRPLVGPLVALQLSDGTARKVALHDALYAGIRRPTGEPGAYFWPVPIEALRAPASTGRVHTLVFVAGQLFRAEQCQAKTIRASLLMHRLGIRWNADRQWNSRGAAELQRTLDDAIRTGVLSGYDVRGEGLADPNALVRLQPGAAAQRWWRGEAGRRPEPLPSTGAELASWLHQTGWSAAAAAEVIGAKPLAVQRAAKYGDRPLPPKIRAALRRRLWFPPPR
jgi:hypothetical protein